MSQTLEGWILLRVEDQLRCLAKWSLEGDGSLYLLFVRTGTVERSFRSDASDPSPVPMDDRVGKPRTRKLSYHTTGRVHLEHRREDIAYMEPLTRLTATNPFAQYLIPSVGGLDPHEGQLGERDLVIDADPNQSAGYEFRVAPHDTAFESPAIGLIFNNYFALQVVPAQHPNSLSGALLPCFTIITPKPGVFANQAIREDQAFIEHKQRVSGSRGMILFPPTSKNDRGTYRVVPSVPMRVQPKIDVDFFDPSLSAVQQVEGMSVRRANVDIRFRVKGAGGFLNDPVAIKSITLDAEIY